MGSGRFMLALAIGAVPMGFLLAWAGSAAGGSSTLLLVLTLVPAGLWCIYLLWTRPPRSKRLDPNRPDYWTDLPALELVERGRPGARTVNRWRGQYLNHWKNRLDWLRP